MKEKGNLSNGLNIHQGHRARLRKRIRNEGLESFEDHTLLEYLLSLTIPRRDTNELAHELLHRFGSFSSVLDASPDELEQMTGISECTATFLGTLTGIMRHYLIDKETRYSDFYNFRDLGSYLTGYYFGLQRERVVAVLLNNRAQMIKLAVISEGTVNESEFSLRKIIEAALQYHAASVVLAHNHPDGNTMPSEEDVRMTRYCQKTLSDLGIVLAEHVIVAADTYYGILSGEGNVKQDRLLAGLFNEKES